MTRIAKISLAFSMILFFVPNAFPSKPQARITGGGTFVGRGNEQIYVELKEDSPSSAYMNNPDDPNDLLTLTTEDLESSVRRNAVKGSMPEECFEKLKSALEEFKATRN